ncbi:MAG: XTP/dITP diphosphatase [Polyangiaceae bacterium]|nr:XTP/dITP diphosphatase [Polyangiaceae bacterium]
MSSTLALATTNLGKVREIRELLADLPISVCTVQELLGQPFHVEETEDSFEGNARLKAEAALQATGKITMADDSGLLVDHLGGRPGVHSARYAGEGATDADNIRLLLEELKGVPVEQRKARFVCVIVLAAPGRAPVTVRGAVEGTIAESPRGSSGFGYDPLFIPDAYPARRFAELSADEKNAISHRGQALRQLRGCLLARFETP